MSRIEMAIEKAVRLREQGGQPSAGEAATTVPETAAEPAAAAIGAPLAAALPVVPPEKVLAPKHPFLVCIQEPHSQAAEEYRKLKSVLVKMTEGKPFRNALMVTSSVPSEGKSLTALNLAVSLAQGLDHTVLLIDADLRRPSLHRYLDLEQGPGLADILMGEADISQTIVQTGIGKLAVIRGGRYIDNPVELFSSQKMKLLVEELKHRYPDRYLIFDTPPVLPFAESRSLAHVVDGVLFVVMERLASQSEIKEAYDHIKGGVLGVVYNAAEDATSEEKYSYYQHYSSGKS